MNFTPRIHFICTTSTGRRHPVFASCLSPVCDVQFIPLLPKWPLATMELTEVCFVVGANSSSFDNSNSSGVGWISFLASLWRTAIRINGFQYSVGWDGHPMQFIGARKPSEMHRNAVRPCKIRPSSHPKLDRNRFADLHCTVSIDSPFDYAHRLIHLMT